MTVITSRKCYRAERQITVTRKVASPLKGLRKENSVQRPLTPFATASFSCSPNTDQLPICSYKTHDAYNIKSGACTFSTCKLTSRKYEAPHQRNECPGSDRLSGPVPLPPDADKATIWSRLRTVDGRRTGPLLTLLVPPAPHAHPKKTSGRGAQVPARCDLGQVRRPVQLLSRRVAGLISDHPTAPQPIA